MAVAAAAAATPNYQIGGLLEKMTNVDKDFRYMAGLILKILVKNSKLIFS